MKVDGGAAVLPSLLVLGIALGVLVAQSIRSGATPLAVSEIPAFLLPVDAPAPVVAGELESWRRSIEPATPVPADSGPDSRRPDWAPLPGSPLALLPLQEACKYRATRENLLAWIADVDELGDIDPESVEYSSELAYLWGICKEQQALNAYVDGYFARELGRWTVREEHVALSDELWSVGAFIERNLNTENVSLMVGLYSVDVLDQIHGDGFDAGKYENRGAWSALRETLLRAGSPSFDAVVTILREKD